LRLPPADPVVAGFHSLSVELTGFDEQELVGTDVGNAYEQWSSRRAPTSRPLRIV
jgi:hypothetical protein